MPGAVWPLSKEHDALVFTSSTKQRWSKTKGVAVEVWLFCRDMFKKKERRARRELVLL